MKLRYHSHGSTGFRLSLVLKEYTYTLWVEWPRLTKFSRKPLS